MHEARAQAVLLVKAIETHDPEGRILPLEVRRAATDAARAAAGEPSEVLAGRAERLLPHLEATVPGIPSLLRVTRFGAGAAPWVAAAALALGLFSNALGPHHRISLLQWWLIGLVLYNLLMYVVFLWYEAKGHGNDDRPSPLHLAPDAPTDDPGPAPRGGRGAGTARRIFDGLVARFTSRSGRRRVGEAEALTSALTAFAASWRRAVMPLLAARVRLLLHMGALGMAIGTVLGMYVRGLGFRYEATWESTFLSADGLQQFLGVVLGPAAAALGTDVPSVAGLQSPSSGPAAPWIHLYAVTALIFVIAPRLLFALGEARRVRRLAADLPVDVGAAYTVKAGAVTGLAGVSAVVIPWSYALQPRARDALVALLHDVLGARADVAVAGPAPYGVEAEEVALPPAADGRRLVVLVTSLAQTPEPEVHGRFLGEAKERAAPGDRWVLLVDAGPFRERLGAGSRLEERSRAWDLVAREAGAPLVHADLGQPAGEALVERLLSAAGPLVASRRTEARP
jgi:hypothetical protein